MANPIIQSREEADPRDNDVNLPRSAPGVQAPPTPPAAPPAPIAPPEAPTQLAQVPQQEQELFNINPLTSGANTFENQVSQYQTAKDQQALSFLDGSKLDPVYQGPYLDANESNFSFADPNWDVIYGLLDDKPGNNKPAGTSPESAANNALVKQVYGPIRPLDPTTDVRAAANQRTLGGQGRPGQEPTRYGDFQSAFQGRRNRNPIEQMGRDLVGGLRLGGKVLQAAMFTPFFHNAKRFIKQKEEGGLIKATGDLISGFASPLNPIAQAQRAGEVLAGGFAGAGQAGLDIAQTFGETWGWLDSNPTGITAEAVKPLDDLVQAAGAQLGLPTNLLAPPSQVLAGGTSAEEQEVISSFTERQPKKQGDRLQFNLDAAVGLKGVDEFTQVWTQDGLQAGDQGEGIIGTGIYLADLLGSLAIKAPLAHMVGYGRQQRLPGFVPLSDGVKNQSLTDYWGQVLQGRDLSLLGNDEIMGIFSPVTRSVPKFDENGQPVVDPVTGEVVTENVPILERTAEDYARTIPLALGFEAVTDLGTPIGVMIGAAKRGTKFIKAGKVAAKIAGGNRRVAQAALRQTARGNRVLLETVTDGSSKFVFSNPKKVLGEAGYQKLARKNQVPVYIKQVDGKKPQVFSEPAGKLQLLKANDFDEGALKQVKRDLFERAPLNEPINLSAPRKRIKDITQDVNRVFTPEEIVQFGMDSPTGAKALRRVEGFDATYGRANPTIKQQARRQAVKLRERGELGARVRAGNLEREADIAARQADVAAQRVERLAREGAEAEEIPAAAAAREAADAADMAVETEAAAVAAEAIESSQQARQFVLKEIDNQYYAGPAQLPGQQAAGQLPPAKSLITPPPPPQQALDEWYDVIGSAKRKADIVLGDTSAPKKPANRYTSRVREARERIRAADPEALELKTPASRRKLTRQRQQANITQLNERYKPLVEAVQKVDPDANVEQVLIRQGQGRQIKSAAEDVRTQGVTPAVKRTLMDPEAGPAVVRRSVEDGAIKLGSDNQTIIKQTDDLFDQDLTAVEPELLRDLAKQDELTPPVTPSEFEALAPTIPTSNFDDAMSPAAVYSQLDTAQAPAGSIEQYIRTNEDLTALAKLKGHIPDEPGTLSNRRVKALRREYGAMYDRIGPKVGGTELEQYLQTGVGQMEWKLRNGYQPQETTLLRRNPTEQPPQQTRLMELKGAEAELEEAALLARESGEVGVVDDVAEELNLVRAQAQAVSEDMSPEALDEAVQYRSRLPNPPETQEAKALSQSMQAADEAVAEVASEYQQLQAQRAAIGASMAKDQVKLDALPKLEPGHIDVGTMEGGTIQERILAADDGTRFRGYSRTAREIQDVDVDALEQQLRSVDVRIEEVKAEGRRIQAERGQAMAEVEDAIEELDAPTPTPTPAKMLDIEPDTSALDEDVRAYHGDAPDADSLEIANQELDDAANQVRKIRDTQAEIDEEIFLEQERLKTVPPDEYDQTDLNSLRESEASFKAQGEGASEELRRAQRFYDQVKAYVREGEPVKSTFLGDNPDLMREVKSRWNTQSHFRDFMGAPNDGFISRVIIASGEDDLFKEFDNIEFGQDWLSMFFVDPERIQSEFGQYAWGMIDKMRQQDPQRFNKIWDDLMAGGYRFSPEKKISFEEFNQKWRGAADTTTPAPERSTGQIIADLNISGKKAADYTPEERRAVAELVNAADEVEPPSAGLDPYQLTQEWMLGRRDFSPSEQKVIDDTFAELRGEAPPTPTPRSAPPAQTQAAKMLDIEPDTSALEELQQLQRQRQRLSDQIAKAATLSSEDYYFGAGVQNARDLHPGIYRPTRNPLGLGTYVAKFEEDAVIDALAMPQTNVLSVGLPPTPGGGAVEKVKLGTKNLLDGEAVPDAEIKQMFSDTVAEVFELSESKSPLTRIWRQKVGNRPLSRYWSAVSDAWGYHNKGLAFPEALGREFETKITQRLMDMGYDGVDANNYINVFDESLIRTVEVPAILDEIGELDMRRNLFEQAKRWRDYSPTNTNKAAALEAQLEVGMAQVDDLSAKIEDAGNRRMVELGNQQQLRNQYDDVTQADNRKLTEQAIADENRLVDRDIKRSLRDDNNLPEIC